MRRVFSAVILLAALPLGLAGCSPATPDLENQAFATQRATIAGVEQDLALGSTLTLTFTSDGISAKAGCNTMFGQASLGDGRITMTTPLGMTMMACDPALMAQDQWISDFLSSGPQWSLDGSVLTLASGDDVIVLRSTTSA